MKIELSGVNAVQAPVERSTKQVATSSTADAPAVTGDRTSLQSGKSTVQSLVSQALQAPSVRQDKVNALREAIASGTYKIDAGAISDSIIAQGNK